MRARAYLLSNTEIRQGSHAIAGLSPGVGEMRGRLLTGWGGSKLALLWEQERPPPSSRTPSPRFSDFSQSHCSGWVRMLCPLWCCGIWLCYVHLGGGAVQYTFPLLGLPAPVSQISLSLSVSTIWIPKPLEASCLGWGFVFVWIVGGQALTCGN